MGYSLGGRLVGNTMRWVAGAAMLAAVGAAQATPPPDIDMDTAGWWTRFCYSITTVVQQQVCNTGPFFVQIEQPCATDAVCCGATLDVAVDKELKFNGETEFNVCGKKFKFGVESSTKTTTHNIYPSPRCGCVKLMRRQVYAAYVETQTVRTCYTSEHPLPGENPVPIYSDPFQVIRRRYVPVPNGGGATFPYYYASACQGCDGPNPPAETNPQIPAVLPTQQPHPTGIWRDWDTTRDGPAPSPDGVYPAMPPGASIADIDFSEAFAGRKILSNLDLNLFETRVIVGELFHLMATSPAFPSESHADIVLNDTVLLSGEVGSLIKGLQQYAKGLVWAKTYGDVDGNGARDAMDLIMLEQQILFPGTVNEQRPYDLNGDGLIDSRDLELMVFFLTQQ